MEQLEQQCGENKSEMKQNNNSYNEWQNASKRMKNEYGPLNVVNFFLLFALFSALHWMTALLLLLFAFVIFFLFFILMIC